MEFFNSAVGVLQTLVVALGAGLGIWGVINLLEGYGQDNPASMLMYDREAPTKQAKTAALSLFRAKGFGRNAHSRMLY